MFVMYRYVFFVCIIVQACVFLSEAVSNGTSLKLDRNIDFSVDASSPANPHVPIVDSGQIVFIKNYLQ